MATTILALVSIIFLEVFVYFVYKFVINSSIQEILNRERNKHLLAIVGKMECKEKETDVKQQKKEDKKEDKKEEKKEEKEQEDFSLTPIQKQERGKMIDAINHHNGDLRKAASRMRMSHIIFYGKAKEYKLIDMLKRGSNVLQKLERQLNYITLRKKGCTMIEAAYSLNISQQTADRYELVYLNNK